MKIVHEGELLAPGLNVGWTSNYVRLIWKTSETAYYFRLRFWPPRIFCYIFHHA